MTADQITRAEETDSGISVAAANDAGFCVSIEKQGDETVVFYEGWHEHFSDAQEAVD